MPSQLKPIRQQLQTSPFYQNSEHPRKPLHCSCRIQDGFTIHKSLRHSSTADTASLLLSTYGFGQPGSNLWKPQPLPKYYSAPDRRRYDVERLAVQPVLQVPINLVERNNLLDETDRIIQVQKLPIRGNLPRFFAVVVSPGALRLRTWVEVLIDEATLRSSRWIRNAPSANTGALTYNCVACQGSSYVVNFWV